MSLHTRTPDVATQPVVADPVYSATAFLLLHEGARKLRTAAIAERAGINESTLFRRYGGLTDIIAKTYEWSWAQVVAAVADASFVRQDRDPQQALISDTGAIWSMRDSPDATTAANFAFLLMRRRHELDIDKPCRSQLLFEARLRETCERVLLDAGQPDDKADLLTTLVMNYVATVLLTWMTMDVPDQDSDMFGTHNLTADEAQLGVFVLLERSRSLQHKQLPA